MKKSIFLILNNLFVLFAFAQHTTYSGNNTPTWSEVIRSYQELDQQYAYAQLNSYGTTDVGKPLHLFVINKDLNFFPDHLGNTKPILLINNAIHPGEPDGVDASLLFCKELLDPKNVLHRFLDSVIVCIIPVYNVDGALLRNGYSRSNQNGPSEYGFRANSKNLDLNRDFMKCDSKNALTFSSLFSAISPHILVDTHVSNGADYPYVMTLISTQSDKIGKPLNSAVKRMEKHLFESMKNAGQEMAPYVNHMGKTPETGIADFLETPRFATGYAALHHTIGFTTETHMLKSYSLRVESTYQFLVETMKYIYENSTLVMKEKVASIDYWMNANKYVFNFELQEDSLSTFVFKGYEAVIEPSLVGTGERLRYDQSKPYEKEIPFFRKYLPKDTVSIPEFYIVPQAWDEVIERLQANNVIMYTMPSDTIIEVTGYYLYNLKTNSRAYEGHFLHSEVQTQAESMNVHFFEGDYLIPVRQPALRYIMEALEPKSKDSFFSWNFFDSVLQQKEWFSDYVFEEKAAEIIQNDPVLKARFVAALATDPEMQEHWMQLYWIYKNSEYYEKSAFRYPIYRLEKNK